MESLYRPVDELVVHIGRIPPEDEAVQKGIPAAASGIEAIVEDRKAASLFPVIQTLISYVKKMAAV